MEGLMVNIMVNLPGVILQVAEFAHKNETLIYKDSLRVMNTKDKTLQMLILIPTFNHKEHLVEFSPRPTPNLPIVDFNLLDVINKIYLIQSKTKMFAHPTCMKSASL